VRVLIVEDEPKLASLLRKGLTAQGLAADVATHGDEAMYMATATSYDAITLDVMLPDTDGFTLCREFRRQGVTTPVLMITALDTIHDRVIGLDSGADDYLAKPFSFAELLARINALGRRSGEARPAVLRRGDIELDPAEHTVTRDGKRVALSGKEFGVLETLMVADGATVSSEQLLERVWDEHADPFTNSVRMTIVTLRRKLGDPAAVQTVRGAGYRV
jgi:DNA-binding response OmpR family regulator